MVALDEADVTVWATNTGRVMSLPGPCIGTVMSWPRPCVEQVRGDVRPKSPSRTTHAEEVEACEVDDEVAATGSRLGEDTDGDPGRSRCGCGGMRWHRH